MATFKFNHPLHVTGGEGKKKENMLLQILDKQKGVIYINTEQIASIEPLNKAAIIIMSNGIKYSNYDFEYLITLLIT